MLERCLQMPSTQLFYLCLSFDQWSSKVIMRKQAIENINLISPSVPNSESILIAEYQRLSDLKKVTVEEFNRRFDIYLTVFTASIAGIITIQQFAPVKSQSQLITIITFVMLVLGWNVFTSMGSANVWNIHLERAARLIQTKFIEREPYLLEYFYFKKPMKAITGTKLSTLIVRGISSGGQKSIVVIANSAAITYLLYNIFNHLGWKLVHLVWYRNITLFIIFLLAGFAHVCYSWWYYRANGIR